MDIFKRKVSRMKLTIKHLNDANLSMKHFAALVGSNDGTVTRYLQGKNVKPESIDKIEIGASVLAETGLVWPDLKHVPTKAGKATYEKNKKKADKLDKKFATAYKKAVKKAGL